MELNNPFKNSTEFMDTKEFWLNPPVRVDIPCTVKFVDNIGIFWRTTTPPGKVVTCVVETESGIR